MNSKQILENLSDHLKNTLARAIGLATSMNHKEVTPLHLFLSVLQEKGSIGSEILKKLKFDEKTTLDILEKKKILPSNSLRGSTVTATLSELSQTSKKALEKAMLLAYEYEQNYVGTEHLLFGIIHTHDEEIENLIQKTNIEFKDLEDQIINILESADKFPDVSDISNMMEEISELAVNNPPPVHQATNTKTEQKNKPSALELFTVDLTRPQEQKNIDPVIGRENEIDRLINILCRRTKNNPVLVGEPGVGKTAIVEGLAKKIVLGEVPDILKRKRIVSLDLTLLISGTIYRGEFEARLRQIIEEISKKPEYILFIDEIHNIIGAGSNQGTMDAANILKPALARGKLRCIGATTIDEYKKYISNDPALERRFQPINVEEPTRDETVQIIQGIAPMYEQYHEVNLPLPVIEKTVDLSLKYIHDNFLPDKAIDLIDEASASVKVRAPQNPLLTEFSKLEKQLEESREKKQECMMSELFEEAKKWKSKEEKLVLQIKEIQKKIEKIKPGKRKNVTIEDVANVLAKKLHTDKNIFLQDEYITMSSVGKSLKSQIIGQDTSIDTIVETLQRSYLGLRSPKRPFASFLFVGPTGVGKTELAKILATEIFHDEKALLKMDMSEFAEQHGVSKLLGSPAGYIGYKERNRFTESIRRRPYSVVLFDEIDKAHPDVIKLLLQILDEGELTDSSGKKLSFAHSLIILTSNIGAEAFKQSAIGFGRETHTEMTPEKKSQIEKNLKESFGAPLIGRLDATCIFTPLSPESLEKIIEKSISKLNKNLKDRHHFAISTAQNALEQILKNIERDLGARQIEQIIEKILYPLLFEKIKTTTTKKIFTLNYEKEHFSLV